MSGENSGQNTPRPGSSSWARSASNRPRVGRVGDWNNDSAPSSSSGSGGRRIATLGSLGGGSSSSRAPPRDESDDDEDENKPQGETYFAGGERSGVSIQGPGGREGNESPGARDLVRNLLRRAAEGGAAPSQQPRSSVFSGGGHVLGSDDVESSFVPDPNAQGEDDTAYRSITLWRQGFQIEDGELMRYDEPGNAEILAQINAGNAPLSLLNARLGQHVELRVAKRTHEDYVPPQGPRAFVGSGNRLGAPVPNAPSGSTAMPGDFPSAAPSQPAASEDRASINTQFEVDQTQPTTSIQIRLADGTRMVARMNLTHTVGDIRNFINASRPENRTRPYTVGTTFPNRVLENDAETVEAAKLQNSVIVQRWA